MRHRARRSLSLRGLRPRLAAALSSRRVAAAATALVVAGAGAGVVIAAAQEGPRPVTTAVPPLADTGTPAVTPGAGDHPSGRVSRSGKRHSVRTTPSPSSTEPAPEPTTGEPTPSTGTSGPAAPNPSPTTSPRTKPSGTSSPSPDPSPAPPVDNDPPQTTATTKSVDADSWTVVLGADEPAGFACSLDGGAWAPCAATATFTDLTHGSHTLAARATDQAGNTDPSPVELTTNVTGPA